MILKPSDVEIQGPKRSIGEKVNGILKSKIILVSYMFWLDYVTNIEI